MKSGCLPSEDGKIARIVQYLEDPAPYAPSIGFEHRRGGPSESGSSTINAEGVRLART
jgi:hypothetical protein